jgi:hypothetical protein
MGKRSKKPTRALRAYLASIGKKGGKKGGPARAKSLSKAELTESARKAAKVRWAGHTPKKKKTKKK